MSERDAIDYLCYDLPPIEEANDDDNAEIRPEANEATPLLEEEANQQEVVLNEEDISEAPLDDLSLDGSHVGLNALELAAVFEAKNFMSQKAVQRIIDGIWKGDIVFWQGIGQQSTKQARAYSEKRSDPYCRLRVPLYLKSFEVAFFTAFLAFYYMVLVEKSAKVVTSAEIMLYIWLISFAYNGKLS